MSVNVNNYNQYYNGMEQSNFYEKGSKKPHAVKRDTSMEDAQAAAYSDYRDYERRAEDMERAEKNKKADDPENKLSEKAKKLLEKLRKQYGNKMDFFVSDNNTDIKSTLSKSNKEFSVIFSVDELEKMANDEKYAKAQMDSVQKAIRMSDEIMKQYGKASASHGKNGGQAEISKIGISIGDDGKMTFFAELEKSSAKQREYMEHGREKRAADKKAAEKKAEEKEKITVGGSSITDLVWKMNHIDWRDDQKNKAAYEYLA